MIPHTDELAERRTQASCTVSSPVDPHDEEHSPMGATDEITTPNGLAMNHQQPHILVVNDTQEILDLFREILEDEGYQVSLYSSTFNDVEEIVALAPDLVILDFMIGGESHGWQLLQKMKMSRKTAGIPVVVCTAALTLARELEGHLRSKNVGLVLKPFDIDDLVAEVRQHLSPAAAAVPPSS
jgi:DNA-binding response OmpR family regulator